MSEPKAEPRSGFKTVATRLPDEMHAQFALVAQLDGMSLGDAMLRAIEQYVSAKKSEGDFAERAAAALAEIEREASTRKSAIEALFGSSDVGGASADADASTEPAEKPTSTRKSRS